MVTARNSRASGVLGMIRSFFTPLRSIPNFGRKLALLAPSTISKGMSGRRADENVRNAGEDMDALSRLGIDERHKVPRLRE